MFTFAAGATFGTFLIAIFTASAVRLFTSVTKISDVPAGTFQLKRCGRYLLDQARFFARRANGQGRIGHPLQSIFFEAAFAANVGVDRHFFRGVRRGRGTQERRTGAKPLILPG